MASMPTRDELIEALIAAGKAHHEFELKYLGGKRHAQWAGWYAAYVLGRLGNFTRPTKLTRLLEGVEAEEKWFKNAAVHVLSKLNSGNSKK